MIIRSISSGTKFSESMMVIEAHDRGEAPVISAKAVVKTGQLKSVKVLHNGMVELCHITISRRLKDNEVEVLSGLNSDQKVVIE